jgi:DNA-binding NarL/FixJ family response regulator
MRIVILDDERGMREFHAAVLRHYLQPEREILNFEDPAEACRELSRTDPDLFIPQHIF